MPNKCSIVNCKGNYNKDTKCRVFKLPKEESERQAWLDVLPPRQDFVLVPSKFFICEKHWPSQSTPHVSLPGGFTRPAIPPSIFNVPASCLPTTKPVERKSKQKDKQLHCFLKKDAINSFLDFSPDEELTKKYNNVIISRLKDKLVLVFMSEDFQNSILSVIVYNKFTLCSPLTLSAFKDGISIPLTKILNPNNGLKSYSQFFEAVHVCYNYSLTFNDVINKVVLLLKAKNSELKDTKQSKKLQFITRQLQLLTDETFSVADYCLAIKSFPNCSYEQLRDLVVLPSKRKIQSVMPSVNIDQVLQKTHQKVKNDHRLVSNIPQESPSVQLTSCCTSCSVASSPSMKRAKVVVHEPTDAEVKRLCCSHDSINQEAAAEDMVHVAIPKSENLPITMMVKNEVPDDELEDITVKEEPIDWHQEPQDRMSAAPFALTFKKEIDDAYAEARTEHAEAEDELREGSSGACNTRAVHQRSAGASQGSADSLPSDVSGSGSGVEVNPPHSLKSARFLCAHCDYSSTRKDKLELHLRDAHNLGFDFKGVSSSDSDLHSNESKLCSEVKHNESIIFKMGSCSEKNLMKQHERAKQDAKILYYCELCEYFSANEKDVKKHQIRKHSKHKLFKCAQCAFTTAYGRRFKLHQARKHSMGTLLRCELCDYGTVNNYCMKMHKTGKHNVGKLYICELCDYSTAWDASMKHHKTTKHNS